MKHYSDHDDNIEIESVTIGGDPVTVVTIYRDIITQWFEDDIECAIIHIEDDDFGNRKFL